MELKNRMVYIIRAALERDGVGIADLLKELSITKRTFYMDFEKINEWLQSNGLGSAIITDQAVRLKLKNQPALLKKLRAAGGYVLSVEERQALELLYIILGAEVVTIQKMQTAFDVSKNTVLKDIRDWKDRLKEYGLSLNSTILKGYFLMGEEFPIRKLIGQQINVLTNTSSRSILRRMIQESLEALEGNEIDFFEIARCAIKQYETDLDTKLVLSDTDYETGMILAACIRGLKGYYFTMDSLERGMIEKTHEFVILKKIIEKLRESQLDIPCEEVYYLTPLFLGIKQFDFNSSAEESSYMADRAKALLDNFERIACVSLLNKEELFTRILYHIRPMVFRLKYSMQVKNPLLEDIQTMYRDIYYFTCRAVAELGGELFSLITPDEIAYLCIYIASHLKEYMEGQGGPVTGKPQKILIICGAGMATSVLLKDQLQTLLGNSFAYEMAMAAMVDKGILEEYLFILTTAKLEFEHKKILTTGLILSEQSKQQIIHIIRENAYTSKWGEEITDIIQVVHHCTEGAIDETKLFFNLFSLYSRKNRVLFPASAMDMLQKALGQARRIQGGQLLPEDRLYQIAPGVMLLAARAAEAEGGGIGLEIEIMQEPLVLSEQRRLQILVNLFTVDNTSHFGLLTEIYNYFQNQENRMALLDEATYLKEQGYSGGGL